MRDILGAKSRTTTQHSVWTYTFQTTGDSHEPEDSLATSAPRPQNTMTGRTEVEAECDRTENGNGLALAMPSPTTIHAGLDHATATTML